MADDKSSKTKKTRFDTNLALVTGAKGEFRKVYVRMALSEVARLREEAKALGISLDEHISILLSRTHTERKQAARTKKKKR